MAGGPSKINPPNSHPSNPIHRKATEAQGLAIKKKPTTTKATNIQTSATDTSQELTTTTKKDSVDTHHVNKALVPCGVWCACFCRLCYLGEKVAILFSLLLGVFFDQERRHEKNKQPSVFAKKCDSLTGRAKHKASDRANQAGQNGAYVFA